MASKLVFTPIPEEVVYIEAPSHGPGFQYRVANGYEKWNQGLVKGTKVHIVKDGRVLGRQSPTYPTLQEMEAVLKAVAKLAKHHLPVD